MKTEKEKYDRKAGELAGFFPRSGGQHQWIRMGFQWKRKFSSKDAGFIFMYESAK